MSTKMVLSSSRGSTSCSVDSQGLISKSHSGCSRRRRVGPKCHCALFTFEKISHSPLNPGRAYFNCPNFPRGCDFFMWANESERFVEQECLDELVEKLQEMEDVLVKRDAEIMEAKAKTTSKREILVGFALGLGLGFFICALLVMMSVRGK